MERLYPCLHPSPHRRRPPLSHRTTAPRAARRRLPQTGLTPCTETLIVRLCLPRQHPRIIASRAHRRCRCSLSRSLRATRSPTSLARLPASPGPTRSSSSTPAPPTAPPRSPAASTPASSSTSGLDSPRRKTSRSHSAPASGCSLSTPTRSSPPNSSSRCSRC